MSSPEADFLVQNLNATSYNYNMVTYKDVQEPRELYEDRQTFRENVIGSATDAQFNIFLPVFCLICLLMVVGLPGNFLALVVYHKKMKKAIARQFLMTLCVSGLLSCAFVMPLELDIMRHFFIHDQQWLCKLLRFFAYSVHNTASLTLLAIAVERYRIICNPWKPSFSENVSRRICYVNVILAIVTSIPMAIIYGTQSIPLKQYPTGFQFSDQNFNTVLGNNSTQLHRTPDFVIGKTCMMDDNMNGSKFPMIIVAFYITSIVCIFLILIVLYGCVTLKLAHRRNESVCQRNSTNSKRSMTKRVVRVTIMTVVLTSVFEICYLPCLVAVCIRLAHPAFYYTLTNAGKMVFNLALKSYLLNSTLYPFIYCFYNNEFRKGLFKLLRPLKSMFIKKESQHETLSKTSRTDKSHDELCDETC